MTIANLETIIDMQSWCRTWALNGSSHIRAKQKLPRKHKRSVQKFLEPDRKPEVIYTDNFLEFGKSCEDLSWNHCTSSPHRSETNGIAERAVRRVKGRHFLLYCCNQVWMKIGGQIPDLFSDGKTPYERRFGKPFAIIPFGSLVEYHPITAKDQSRMHQFGKKVLLGLFFGYALYAGGEFGRVTYWLQTLRSWKRWTHLKYIRKDSMQKRRYFPKKMENSFLQSQMDESNFLEEIRN